MMATAALLPLDFVFTGDHYLNYVAGKFPAAVAIALAAQISHRLAFSSRFARTEKAPELAPVSQGAQPPGRPKLRLTVPPGLTSQPSVILLLAGALLLLVLINFVPAP